MNEQPISISPKTIEVDHLSKRYDNATALSDISFSVERGSIVGFLGPNGAGKTTTLRIMTGVLAATSGTVRIGGIDVAENSLEARKRLGYVPENVSLYSELRVEEYLDFRARLKRLPRAKRRERTAYAMDQCALTQERRKLVGRLSKGFRQRVALADALLAEPEVLILDEPTVGLDPHQIRQTRELVRDLGRHTTILLSTHILPEVESLCNKVVIIHKGRIVAEDRPEHLRQRLSQSRVATVRVELKAEEARAREVLAALPGVREVRTAGTEGGYTIYDLDTDGADAREAVYQAAVAQRWSLRELSLRGASLEDAFISLTRREEAG